MAIVKVITDGEYGAKLSSVREMATNLDAVETESTASVAALAVVQAETSVSAAASGAAAVETLVNEIRAALITADILS